MWIVTSANPRINTELFYKSNDLLNLLTIDSCLIRKCMLNVYHGQIPHIFERFLTQNHEIHDHNTRIASHLHILSYSIVLSQASIRFQAAIMWNEILKAGIINTDCFEASFQQMLKMCPSKYHKLCEKNIAFIAVVHWFGAKLCNITFAISFSSLGPRKFWWKLRKIMFKLISVIRDVRNCPRVIVVGLNSW